MPSLSIYINDEIYAKLLACGEKPSALVTRLIVEYLAKVKKLEVYETLTMKFWDKDIHILLDKSKPENEQYVMQSENLNEIEAYIKKMKDTHHKR